MNTNAMRAAVTAMAVITALPTAAEARTVAHFLAVATPLRDKGMLALMDPAFEELNAEADAALEGWKAAAKAPGSGVCPAAGAGDMSVDSFLALLRSYPAPAARTTPVGVAVRQLLDARYRCKPAGK